MTREVTSIYRCDNDECDAWVLGNLPSTWALFKSEKKHFCEEHIIRHCLDCGREMRPQKTKAEQYPGTVRYYANGRCANCARGRTPIEGVPDQQVKYIRRLVESRLDDPDDRLLVLDQLGLLGTDID